MPNIRHTKEYKQMIADLVWLEIAIEKYSQEHNCSWESAKRTLIYGSDWPMSRIRSYAQKEAKKEA